jgi:hypothetical protein
MGKCILIQIKCKLVLLGIKINNEITCEVDSDKNKYSTSFTLKRERGDTVMKSFLSKLNFIRRLPA